MGYSVDYSSLTKSRMSRLNNLSQAIEQNQGQEKRFFQALYKGDRERILAILEKSNIFSFDQNTIAKQGLTGRTQAEIGTMQKELTKIASLEKPGRNRLRTLPLNLMVHSLSPFITEKSLTDLQTACVDYSSLSASRFQRLNNLSRAIEQDTAEVQALFQELHKDDRAMILDKFNSVNFDWTSMKKNKEAFLKQIHFMKAKRSFVLPSSKSRINHMRRIPPAVMSNSLGAFLTPAEITGLQMSSRDASWKILGAASSIIRTYHLEPLIKTYLHQSCAQITQKGQIKALEQLMSMVFRLSKIEMLPPPSIYQSLGLFLELIEARNLIRMMDGIKRTRPALPNLVGQIETLEIPEGSAETMEKAKLLCGWIEKNKNFLTTLTSLDIAYAGLTGLRLSLLPKEIGQLTGLKELDLSSTYIFAIPTELFQLKALKKLYLGNNNIDVIPLELSQLKTLKSLDLSYNRILIIPQELFQLKALKELRLENNRIVVIPPELGRLKALKKLYLASNRIAVISPELGQLKALKELRLENNRIAVIPPELGRLKALKELRLQNNRIADIPPELGQLNALKELNLENNRIAVIPLEFFMLKKLNPHLHSSILSKNGLISLPVGIPHSESILRNQNEQLQLQNIIHQLFACFKEKHDTKKIGQLLNTLEELFGKEIRGRLHRCLFEVAQKASETDISLRSKLRDPKFNQKGFLVKEISQQLKKAALEKFSQAMNYKSKS